MDSVIKHHLPYCRTYSEHCSHVRFSDNAAAAAAASTITTYCDLPLLVTPTRSSDSATEGSVSSLCALCLRLPRDKSTRLATQIESRVNNAQTTFKGHSMSAKVTRLYRVHLASLLSLDLCVDKFASSASNDRPYKSVH